MSVFITGIETLSKRDKKKQKYGLNAKKFQIVNIKFLSEKSLHLYVHRCVFTYVSMYAHICTCVWKADDSLRYNSSGTLSTLIFRQGFH